MTTTHDTFNHQATASHSKKSEDHDKPIPFCLRLSQAEREILEREAGNKPLGTYIRSRLFPEQLTKRRAKRKARGESHKSVGQILALLGQTRIPQNMGQLLIASQNSPQLFTAELCSVIKAAYDDVTGLRKHLITASGHKSARLLDHEALRSVVQRLKNPRLGNQLNQIVKSIHIGAFVLSPEVQNLLMEICVDVHTISTTLLHALTKGGAP